MLSYIEAIKKFRKISNKLSCMMYRNQIIFEEVPHRYE